MNHWTDYVLAAAYAVALACLLAGFPFYPW